MDKTPEDQWRDLSEHMLTEITQWRTSHPKATLREIEDEVHRRMSRLEVQLIQDTAQRSPSRGWSGASGKSDPLSGVWHSLTGPRQASPPAARSRRTTHHAEPRLWHLPDLWDRAFSRLYEKLGLLPGSLSPQSQD